MTAKEPNNINKVYSINEPPIKTFVDIPEESRIVEAAECSV
jgi:hypothetical protein